MEFIPPPPGARAAGFTIAEEIKRNAARRKIKWPPGPRVSVAQQAKQRRELRERIVREFTAQSARTKIVWRMDEIQQAMLALDSGVSVSPKQVGPLLEQWGWRKKKTTGGITIWRPPTAYQIRYRLAKS